MSEHYLRPLDLDAEAILLKADANPDAMTVSSSISGLNYVIGKDGGILILEKHQYFGATLDDMRVIHQEMNWIINEAERWTRS